METRKWALALAIQAANAAPRGEIGPADIERWAQRFCRFAMLGVFDEHPTLPKETIRWGGATYKFPIPASWPA
jgi:hypothetical protein